MKLKLWVLFSLLLGSIVAFNLQEVNMVYASDTLIASYGTENYTDYYAIQALHPSSSSYYSAVGISFQNTASYTKITSCKFDLQKIAGTTGGLKAKLYAHTGSYGFTSLPGTLLATSGEIDVATQVSTSMGLVEFLFTGAEQYTMQYDTYYCIDVEVSTVGNMGASYGVRVGRDNTPSYSGNTIRYYSSAWSSDTSRDTLFYVYGVQTFYYIDTYYSGNGRFKINNQLMVNGTIDYESKTNPMNIVAYPLDNATKWIKWSLNGVPNYTNNLNCTLTANMTVWAYFESIPSPITYTTSRFKFSPSNPAINETVSFYGNWSVTSGSITGYSWNFGDSGTSSNQNPTHKYSASGNYTVTLNVTSSVGTNVFTEYVNIDAVSGGLSIPFFTLAFIGGLVLFVLVMIASIRD